jgi:hypothetical protein
VRKPSLVLGALIALAGPGCFRIDVYAPPGPPVRLLSREEATAVKRQQRTWFAVLGAVPLDGTMPAHITRFEDFREVRIRVTDTIPDAFIGGFNTVVLAVGILAQTYEVLGNRPAEPAGTAPASPSAAQQPPESQPRDAPASGAQTPGPGAAGEGPPPKR